MPKRTVEIEWDEPDDPNWLNKHSIQMVLGNACKNTAFTVKDVVDDGIEAVLAIRSGEYRCYSNKKILWVDAYHYRVALIPTPPLGTPRDESANGLAVICSEFSETTVQKEPHWHWVNLEPSTKELIGTELNDLCKDWYVHGEWAYLAVRRYPFPDSI